MLGRDGEDDHDDGRECSSTQYLTCSASTNTVPNSSRNLQYQNDILCPVRYEALRMNHEAVKILMSGKGEEKALLILKLALARMKENLAFPSLQETRRSSTTRISSKASSSEHGEGLKYMNTDTGLLHSARNRNHLCNHLKMVPVSLSMTEDSVCDSSSFFFYTKVFTFRRGSGNLVEINMLPSCLSSMIIDSEILSSIIIYNIALTLTVKGLRTNNSMMLKRALDLYKLSLALQQQAHIMPSLCIKSLAIVCWNNLGHIAYLLGHFEHVQNMRRMLHTLLLTLPTHEGEQTTDAAYDTLFLFDDMDIQGFKSNIMFMYPPKIAPAA